MGVTEYAPQMCFSVRYDAAACTRRYFCPEDHHPLMVRQTEKSPWQGKAMGQVHMGCLYLLGQESPAAKSTVATEMRQASWEC